MPNIKAPLAIDSRDEGQNADLMVWGTRGCSLRPQITRTEGLAPSGRTLRPLSESDFALSPYASAIAT